MKQVCNNLYVGNEYALENQIVGDDWRIIQAAKYPFHQQAVGYKSQISRLHPEYLFAYRGNRLILNMVDADSVNYVSKIVVDEALKFIKDNIDKGNILIQCNAGRSRSASLAFLYLVSSKKLVGNLDECLNKFWEIYPEFRPGLGMIGFINQNFSSYAA